MTHRLEALAGHALDSFTCGVDELDDWLRLHARNATGHGTRTYVLVDHGGHVVGYFAIAPHVLQRHEAPSDIGRGAPQQIPAILLAKLALDVSLHGQGLGAELLVAALDTVVDAARRAGGRLVVVDAIDEHAAEFYRRHDFRPLPQRPDRLVMKLSTAAKALGRPWP